MAKLTKEKAPKLWSGNKGDWGEAYVFLKLLSDNVLHNADRNGNKIDNEYSIVSSILRQEQKDKLEYCIGTGTVVIFRNDEEDKFQMIRRSAIKRHANSMRDRMKTQKGRSFSLPDIQAFLEKLGWKTLKAKSSSKADTQAIVRDGGIGAMTLRKYSIKSLMGAKPSLISGSRQTYIDYTVKGLTQSMADRVLAVKSTGRKKIVDRARALAAVCEENDLLIIPKVRSKTYETNMFRCYWKAPEVIAASMFCSYLQEGKHMVDTIANMRKCKLFNLSVADDDDYENSLRKYLWNSAFGMMPGTLWNGRASADGYLIITKTGELITYPVSRVTDFEEYLLTHTYWDSPENDDGPEHGDFKQNDEGDWLFTLSCKVRYDIKGYNGNNLQYISHDENGMMG